MVTLLLRQVLHGYELSQPDETHDRRTDAEKRHAERMSKLEEERLRKLAAKSHRERVKEFNDHLSNLSEHHDIPKVRGSAVSRAFVRCMPCCVQEGACALSPVVNLIFSRNVSCCWLFDVQVGPG